MTQKVPKHVLYRPLKGYNCFNDFFVGYRFYYGSNLTACLVGCDPLDSRFVLRTTMVVTVWYLAGLVLDLLRNFDLSIALSSSP